ncbi:MAG: type ISP restriction/modification enzyme [Ferrovum myxofaciens]|uniref:DEAD/DEAH box helicase n=1 Tax=Ferrovum myxofaciens TaxID=416213 RepID=UPI001AF78E17|nr:type ISP restriction/modification enzyme [Ferrovum myxofaciens]QKE37994.1 MAG: DEAD/DEAH box helicase [Ferrovum myxofaciens]
MSALSSLLDAYHQIAQTQREKGTYFEDLILCYLKNEPKYRDLYESAWTYSDWARLQGINAQDAGIDLVAEVRGTGEFHAIQCKLYAPDYVLRKEDIDSFMTASGKIAFTHRLIFSTCLHWSHHAESAIEGQTIPVSRIDLYDLETSAIDWARYQPKQAPPLRPKKSLMPHQKEAVRNVLHGLHQADRGKLIMACGTGKTFTSLKIAESLAGPGKQVLFLVPSLALLSQSLTEWTQESEVPLHSFAVCSDSDVGKKGKRKEEDRVETLVHELRYPATTDAAKLAGAVFRRRNDAGMTVIFSTYHSIEVIHRAQKHHGLPAFDLIVCDEAHRTTGATFDDEDESTFVRVHNQDHLNATKRLYMTATPRVYGNSAKAKAETDNVVLCSMDDEALYGRDLHVITFSTAVQLGLLVDYKVIVLAVEEAHVSRRLQELLKDENNQLKVDDAARIVGCWKALSKQGLTEDDWSPMRRAVAFCQVIERAKEGKVHKVSSKQIAGMFQSVVEAYQEQEEFETEARLICEAEHVDGSMNASEKEAKLVWLKEPSPDHTCRILSNVRCLSEGVDVPALDAVLFLTPRNSQVDVVQSVGRVMRNAPGKKLGYVILPVVIPVGVEPHEALNDNKTYAVVWQVLQALRSHDDRFDAMVNKLDLIGRDPRKMEVIAITDKIQRQAAKTKDKITKPRGPSGRGSHGIGEPAPMPPYPVQQEIQFEIGEIERAIYARLVQKVGNRHHWEDWANDIAKIANTHIDRIRGILENPDNREEQTAFAAFATDLRHNLNDSISNDEIIEMLAQHLITKPVFDALFEGYSFARHNPISQAMQSVVDILESHQIGKEADTLQAFYDSVKFRAAGIDNAAGKQKIVVELYDKFFRNAFPRMSERLGIVYTPVEVVDFIIHSVNHILKVEFDQTLGSPGVHILDPFTGTGTFITRLLQSGLITPEELPYKYQNEIHANEIVLLAYYIAAINIEATYHGIVGGEYKPFEGICLTDTFQLYEKEDLGDAMLVQNSNRRRKQRNLDIRVILGNPPYSVGQTSANDNNQNVGYPHLDTRIANTYAAKSVMTSVKNLYDSYIRAIRWASDRIGDSGVIGFVTNAGYLDSNSADGLRKCLAEEFSSIYVFHLRGNARTAGELRRKEKDNVFGMGSRAPIAISLLVKNPNGEQQGQIYFHDIGDYLTREEKLGKLIEFGSIAGITEQQRWQTVTPDQHGDWLNQRDDGFSQYVVMGDKKSAGLKLFENFSLGVATGRDAWCYNASSAHVETNMRSMITFYNDEVDRFDKAHPGLDKAGREAKVDGFINADPGKISWTHNLKQDLINGKRHLLDKNSLIASLYRPFTKQWLSYNRRFNERVYQMPRIFPDSAAENRVIATTAIGSRNGFSCLISNRLVDLNSMEAGAKCFPLYLYDEGERVEEPVESRMDSLFGESHQPVARSRTRRYALTDEGLAHFETAYPGEAISKEDVFYYIYGLLHSPDYRAKYADNLAKELPRIPCVPGAEKFWAFCEAGRQLADLHLNYETVEPYPLSLTVHGNVPLTDADYRVVKMRYGKTGKEKDLTTIHYNDRITISEIPLEAYEYIVNGKPALDWVVERQCLKTDKDSGIVSDANDWAVETMKNPRYPLELVQRVARVSLETDKIVKTLDQLYEPDR